jgi:hypothetical protein
MSGFTRYVLDGLLCPCCGQATMTCQYWDNGAGYYFYDNFRHRCSNPACRYVVQSLENYGGQSPYEYDWPNCPFCGRNAVDPERNKQDTTTEPS